MVYKITDFIKLKLKWRQEITWDFPCNEIHIFLLNRVVTQNMIQFNMGSWILINFYSIVCHLWYIFTKISREEQYPLIIFCSWVCDICFDFEYYKLFTWILKFNNIYLNSSGKCCSCFRSKSFDWLHAEIHDENDTSSKVLKNYAELQAN